MDKPLPEVLALVVADQFYRDDRSANLSLLGIRGALGASALPLNYPRLVVYAVLVDGRGTMLFELRVVDVDEEREPIYELGAEVTFPDPLTEAELIFEMNELTFPEAGEYRVQLWSEGQFPARAPFDDSPAEELEIA